MKSTPWVSRLVVAAVVVVAIAGSVALLNRGGQQPLASSVVHGDGLNDLHDGFQLVPVTVPEERGESKPVAFRILDKQDRPLTQYDEHRSQRLHLYVARDDLHAYQHLEPKLDGGVWRATIAVPDGGQYRLFAEFVPRVSAETAHPIRLGVPFIVPGNTKFVPLPAPAASATADGVTVSRTDGTAQPRVGRETTLRFRLSAKPENAGELTAFSANTLAMVQVRPADGSPKDGELSFRARFTERGEHRLFLEFRSGGKQHLVAFTVFAT